MSVVAYGSAAEDANGPSDVGAEARAASEARGAGESSGLIGTDAQEAADELRVDAGTCTAIAYTPPTASQEQLGTLCVPTVVGSDAVILLIHGGGGVTGDRDDLAAWQAYYASAGYVTFSIDYQLLDATASTPLYPIPEQNAKAAVQFLRLHEGELGTTRVIVQGHSAGARIGAILLTTPDDTTFAGRELWPDVSDAVDGFVGLYGYYDGHQFDQATYYGDGPTPTVAISTDRAAQASGPALLLHGEGDTIVPADQSVRFADALTSARASADVVLVDGANHGFDGYGRPELTPAGLDAAATVLDWLAD